MKLFIFQLCMLLLLFSDAKAFDLTMHGELLALPCTVMTEDADQLVSFGVLTTKTFYLYRRTLPKAFSLRLKECDISVGRTVEIVFLGSPSVEQVGLLALGLVSGGAKGVAIGLQYVNKELPLGVSTGKLNLSNGLNMFNFSAYVQGDPSAIQNRSIQEGVFSAVAQFSLIYP